MDNLELYNKFRKVPEDAKKPISGGRLKGMTDINPMWRIKLLTEQFGPAGKGWYYEITKQETEEGASGERVAFVNINLYVKFGDEWSKPIQGTGGSSFIAKEKAGLYTSDECYKMALTDAISVACKALGIGADVYFAKDRSKYDTPLSEPQQKQTTKNAKASTSTTQTRTQAPPQTGNNDIRCADCGEQVTPAVKAYCHKYLDRFKGKIVCQKHQANYK